MVQESPRLLDSGVPEDGPARFAARAATSVVPLASLAGPSLRSSLSAQPAAVLASAAVLRNRRFLMGSQISDLRPSPSNRPLSIHPDGPHTSPPVCGARLRLRSSPLARVSRARHSTGYERIELLHRIFNRAADWAFQPAKPPILGPSAENNHTRPYDRTACRESLWHETKTRF